MCVPVGTDPEERSLQVAESIGTDPLDFQFCFYLIGQQVAHNSGSGELDVAVRIPLNRA